jgi:acyl carrier protein
MTTFLRVQKSLAASLDIPKEIIKPETTLDDLFWEKRGTPPDSMDIVELMMALEVDFEISEDDVESMPSSLFIVGDTTVQQIVALIEKKEKG